jgi:hypothetical protein
MALTCCVRPFGAQPQPRQQSPQQQQQQQWELLSQQGNKVQALQVSNWVVNQVKQ